MMMKRWALAVTMTLMLPLVGAAGPCATGNAGGSRSDSGGVGFPDPQPYPHPEAGNGAPHRTANPGAPTDLQNPAPPPADPGPYQSAGEAVFVLKWQDERAGNIEFTVNGSVGAQTIPAPQPRKGGDGKYHGSWEKVVSVLPGQVIGFTWYPVNKNSWSMCTLYHKGQIVDWQNAPSGGCAVGFTVT